jgi:hypothetical protein
VKKLNRFGLFNENEIWVLKILIANDGVPIQDDKVQIMKRLLNELNKIK